MPNIRQSVSDQGLSANHNPPISVPGPPPIRSVSDQGLSANHNSKQIALQAWRV